jgi:hypothetical protein
MSTCSYNEKRGRRQRHCGLWFGVVGMLLIFVAQSAYAQLAPPPGTVRIESIEAIGSGCPPGTFVDNISGDQLAFTLAYSEYTAEDGPGIPRTEARKNCNVLLDITYPIGWTFAIFAVDFRGFADLDNNTVGTVAAQYFFQGQSPQVEFEKQIFGPVFDNYEIRDEIATRVTQFGPCGGGKSLNINTEVRVQGTGALTADSTTGSFQQIYAFVWQQC